MANKNRTAKLLSAAYYNLKNPSAFGREENVYLAVKKALPNLKRKDVKEWFERQLTHSLHKPVRYNFKRLRTIVTGIDEQWQADLCDVSSLTPYNDNHTFLLTCIDCFSKYAWVQPLSQKNRCWNSASSKDNNEWMKTKTVTNGQGHWIHERKRAKVSSRKRRRVFRDWKWKESEHRRTIQQNAKDANVQVFYSKQHVSLHRHIARPRSRIQSLEASQHWNETG